MQVIAVMKSDPGREKGYRISFSKVSYIFSVDMYLSREKPDHSSVWVIGMI